MYRSICIAFSELVYAVKITPASSATSVDRDLAIFWRFCSQTRHVCNYFTACYYYSYFTIVLNATHAVWSRALCLQWYNVLISPRVHLSVTK